MKKLSKKIVSIVLVLMLSFTCSITAFAENKSNDSKSQINLTAIEDFKLNKDDGPTTVIYQADSHGKQLNASNSQRASFAVFHIGYRSDDALYWEVSSTLPDITAVSGTLSIKDLSGRTLVSKNINAYGLGGVTHAMDVVTYYCTGDPSRVRISLTNGYITTITGGKQSAGPMSQIISHSHAFGGGGGGGTRP